MIGFSFEPYTAMSFSRPPKSSLKDSAKTSSVGSLQMRTMMDRKAVACDESKLQQQIVDYVKNILGRNSETLDEFGVYQATSLALRSRIIDNWRTTLEAQRDKKVKSVSYLSLEYLMG
ncbi:glycosyl transferase, family 35, partial [Kipferlia bialata]|eukprot:g7911.t1